MPAFSSIIKKQLSYTDYFIIAANLVPVAGVLFFNWSAKEIFFIYCLETIIVGIFNLVKMGMVTSIRKTDTWYNGPARSKQHGLFFMFFFLIHYGFFVAIQMSIFLSVSGVAPGDNITVFNFIYKWPQLIKGNAWYMLAGFLISYGFGMFYNFLYSGDYKTISLTELMFQPYIRIFVQQFTVIVGSMFLQFGAGQIFIVLFAGIKIFFEVIVNFEKILKKQMKELKNEVPENKISDI